LSFTLTNNNRESLRVTPVADLRERAYQIFGGEFIGDLIEVLAESGEMRARGFVSSPSATRTNRDSQYFFINGRYVRDKIIGKALSEAYRAMIPSGVYPSAMLFVELPPGEVDVNVHPAKTEVRFVRGAIVHDLIRDAVRAAISSAKAGATYFIEKKIEPVAPEPAPIPQAGDLFLEKQPPIPREDSRSAFRFQAPAAQPQPVQQKIDLSFNAESKSERFNDAPAPDVLPDMLEVSIDETASLAPFSASSNSSSGSSSGALSGGPAQYGNRIGCMGARVADHASSQLKPAQNLTLAADEINPVAQLHNSFIIAADRAGLLLIDQHVAHERILFEQHWRALRGKRVEVQRMLIPETIDLTPAQASAFDQLAPELEENGFEIGRLSGRTVAIKAVPAMLAPGAAQSLLAELLDAIEEDRKGLSLDELRAEIAAGLACRAAIKINMELALEKMRWLIDELLKMENPATCPHGRPIILRITSREIEKGFQRT
jgi:DNA mismatch repair protein MutL